MLRSTSIITLAVMLAMPQAVQAQTREITGTVTAADGSTPLVGATVTVEGTTLGTLTGPEGRFRLTIPAGQQVVCARGIW